MQKFLNRITPRRIKQVTLAMLAFIVVVLGTDYWNYTQLQQLVEVNIQTNDWVYARFPIRQKDFVSYTSPYGERWGRLHAGIDIAVDVDKDVLAWWDGVVDEAGPAGGCGNVVGVTSGRWAYRYCHLNTVNVKVGDKVKAGDVVGLSGNTGNSTGPHLHWEVYFKDNLVDPARVIRAMRAADKSTAALPASYPISEDVKKHDKKCSRCVW